MWLFDSFVNKLQPHDIIFFEPILLLRTKLCRTRQHKNSTILLLHWNHIQASERFNKRFKLHIYYFTESSAGIPYTTGAAPTACGIRQTSRQRASAAAAETAESSPLVLLAPGNRRCMCAMHSLSMSLSATSHRFATTNGAPATR